jgi:hypothetical protein
MRHQIRVMLEHGGGAIVNHLPGTGVNALRCHEVRLVPPAVFGELVAWRSAGPGATGASRMREVLLPFRAKS